MLPPDNFQEDPNPVVAHRTSPTNLGLLLLSTVAARDFGWIGTLEAVERLEATLATMERLKRFRGHFFNWYDTRDLRPLEPRLHLVGRQRQSGRPSDRARQRLCGVARQSPPMHAAPSPARATAWRSPARRCWRCPTTGAPSSSRRASSTSALDDLAAALRSCRIGWTSWCCTPATAADLARALGQRTGRRCQRGHAVLGRGRRSGRSRAIVATSRRTATAIAALERRLQTIEIDGPRHGQRHGVRFPARSGAPAAVDRLSSLPRTALDPSCYDLLASEARLASFVAIAKGDVPARHWFRLGREVTPVGRGAALISWSGSMFEYLMPSLVMRAPLGSLIEKTNDLIVRRQIDYGAGLGVPWGISESAYNARDKELTYQYSNFGVPGLGFKRGLSENVVIAPYATALAAMVDPAAAAANFAALAAIGGRGRYGFYEALDFTPARLPEGQAAAVVRAYMAHHQGMTVVAIANALLDGVMRTRFHAEPMVQATELLLQERTPRDVAVAHPRAEEVGASATVRRPRAGRRASPAQSARRQPVRRTCCPTAATP